MAATSNGSSMSSNSNKQRNSDAKKTSKLVPLVFQALLYSYQALLLERFGSGRGGILIP